MAINDIMTARLRGGWTFDRFMPYGFIGLAVAGVLALHHFGRQHQN